MIDNAEVIKGLASAYYALFYIELDTDSYTECALLEQYAHFRDINSRYSKYSEAMQCFVDECVHPDFRHLFDDFCSCQKLKDVLRSCKKKRVVFLQKVNGRYSWTEIIIVKFDNIDDEATRITVGFVDVDDQVRQDMHCQAVLKSLTDGYEVIDYITINENKMDDVVETYQRAADMPLVPEGFLRRQKVHDMLDQFCDTLVWEADRERFYKETRRELIMEDFAKGLPHVVSFRADVNGVPVHYKLRFVEVPSWEGKMEYVMALRNVEAENKREIAIQNKVEEALAWAEEANQAKSTFLFNMSHDIRTPMNAILGFNKLALQHIGDRERAEKALRKADKAGQYLIQLIDDVLEMARIENGKVSLDAIKTDIIANIDNVATMLAGSANEKEIRFTHQYINVNDRMVFADAARLEQIFINIASNAIKYTKRGGSVSMSVEQLPEAHLGMRKYRFVVADTGIGMSEDFLEHIFDLFSREKNSTQSQIQGTGLGMAIVKQLVDMMHGAIKIDSELGKGTTVAVELEFLAFTEPKEILNGSKSEKSISGMKVLVVDDNELNREIVKEILTDLEVEVAEADDGSTAIDILSNSYPGQFDAVLMDVQMPIIGGYKATQEIRRFANKQIANIPIIAMTANTFNEDKAKAMDAGMNDHLGKPIDIAALVACLRKYC